jgi:hypothetical protein
MKHIIRIFLVILSLLAIRPCVLNAAKPGWIDTLEVSGGSAFSLKREQPYWIWSNRDGRIPQSGNTAFVRLHLNRYGNDKKDIEWRYGIDMNARTSANPVARWSEAWMGIRYHKILVTFGQKPEHFGLADSVLTAGPEDYSQNAPPIPKVVISTNGYVDVTKWLGINAYLAHGWMGESYYVPNTWLHEKFLYLRLGNTCPDAGINFFGGIHDIALWGGKGNPASFSDFLKVFAGKRGSTGASIYDQENALGDHRGAIEFAVLSKGYDRDMYLYAQSMYEDGSGLKFWDYGDYMVGGSLILKEPENSVKRINFEYIDTRMTSGSKTAPDDYFFNYAYGGWLYQGYAIGHPFVRFIQNSHNVFMPQNRITGINGAVLARFDKLINPLLRIAWIRNSGSFSSPLSGGNKIRTIACDLSNTMYLDNGWSFVQQFSVDLSNQAGPQPGAMLTISKSLF